MTDKEPLVSVIIPTHNRAEMLKRAVDSVLKQSYSNIEIIIIVDNCTDNTSEVITQLMDKRIVVITLDENVGGAQARNIGIDNAKGEYFAFLDDDDEWYESKLSKQLSAFRNNDNIAIVSCNYKTMNGNKITRISNAKNKINIDDMLYKNHCGSFSFCVIKKEYVIGLRINPDLKACQDWDLWLKILVNSGKQAKTLKPILTKYHEGHDDRLTKNYQNVYSSYIRFLREYFKLMNDSHKNYYIYKLMLMKRKLNRQSTFFYSFKLNLNALVHYKRSKHNQKLVTMIYMVLYRTILIFWKEISDRPNGK